MSKMLSFLYGMWHACDSWTTGMTNPLISNPQPARHATTPTPSPPQAYLEPTQKQNPICRKSKAQYRWEYDRRNEPLNSYVRKLQEPPTTPKQINKWIKTKLQNTGGRSKARTQHTYCNHAQYTTTPCMTCDAAHAPVPNKHKHKSLHTEIINSAGESKW